VLQVKYKETLVVLLFAFKTDTFATGVFSSRAVQLGCVVNTEDRITMLDADIALRLSPGAIDISARR
jgi:hypothetical protein